MQLSDGESALQPGHGVPFVRKRACRRPQRAVQQMRLCSQRLSHAACFCLPLPAGRRTGCLGILYRHERACLHYPAALKARDMRRARVAGNTCAATREDIMGDANIDKETLAVNQRRSVVSFAHDQYGLQSGRCRQWETQRGWDGR